MGSFISELKKYAELQKDNKIFIKEFKIYFGHKLEELMSVITDLYEFQQIVKSENKMSSNFIIRNKYGYIIKSYGGVKSDIEKSKEDTIKLLEAIQSIDYIPPNNFEDISLHAIIIMVYGDQTMNLPPSLVDLKVELSMFKLMGAAKSLLSHFETIKKTHPKAKYEHMVEKKIKQSLSKKEFVYKIYDESDKIKTGMTINAVAETIEEVFWGLQKIGDIPENISSPKVAQIKRYLQDCIYILDDFRYVGRNFIKQS